MSQSLTQDINYSWLHETSFISDEDKINSH